MTMIYSNPVREQEVGALPDVEVWEHTGIGHNADPRMQCVPTIESSSPECSGNGWYWRNIDGTGPYGGIMGPFDTEAEAVADAQADASVDESETDGYGDHNAEPDDEIAECMECGSLGSQACAPDCKTQRQPDVPDTELPLCVLAMRCYCAGHARGNPASEPCDTSETAPAPTPSLYQQRKDADAAWSAELRRLFGKRAGDVRYTAEGKGAPGSKLRELHDAFMVACYGSVDGAK